MSARRIPAPLRQSHSLSHVPDPTASDDEIDAAYEAYDRIPMNTPDAWGDLESFVLAKWGDAPGQREP